jgi:hypothetical protein
MVLSERDGLGGRDCGSGTTLVSSFGATGWSSVRLGLCVREGPRRAAAIGLARKDSDGRRVSRVRLGISTSLSSRVSFVSLASLRAADARAAAEREESDCRTASLGRAVAGMGEGAGEVVRVAIEREAPITELRALLGAAGTVRLGVAGVESRSREATGRRRDFGASEAPSRLSREGEGRSPAGCGTGSLESRGMPLARLFVLEVSSMVCKLDLTTSPDLAGSKVWRPLTPAYSVGEAQWL